MSVEEVGYGEIKGRGVEDRGVLVGTMGWCCPSALQLRAQKSSMDNPLRES